MGDEFDALLAAQEAYIQEMAEYRKGLEWHDTKHGYGPCGGECLEERSNAAKLAKDAYRGAFADFVRSVPKVVRVK